MKDAVKTVQAVADYGPTIDSSNDNEAQDDPTRDEAVQQSREDDRHQQKYEVQK